MSLIRKHGAVLQAWACLDLVYQIIDPNHDVNACVSTSKPRYTKITWILF